MTQRTRHAMTADEANFWVNRYHQLTGNRVNDSGLDLVDPINANAMGRKAIDKLCNVHCQHRYTAMDSCPGCDYDNENGNEITWTDDNAAAR